ncbi:hypothetical protein MD484_g5969, partial [Candolleomyces efflorescens]
MLSPRRRWLIVSFCLIAVFLVVQLARFGQSLGATSVQQTPLREEACKTLPSWDSPWNYLNFDHPTTRAKDNLRNDTHYVTAFAIGGFTNELISAIHLIYLGILTRRVPILPPIIPAAHVSEDAGTLAFSDVFNLTFLRHALRYPILEWQDLKSLDLNISVLDAPSASDPALERFGCWSTQKRTIKAPAWSFDSENVLKLDLGYTRVPDFVYLDPGDQKELFTTFPGLAVLVQSGYPHPASTKDDLVVLRESRLGGKGVVRPDERLACFDMLFYTSTGLREFEFEERWSPVWNNVGRHFRFQRDLVDHAKVYILKAFGIEEGGDVPPMITVHIRRGDFDLHCKAGEQPPCYIPNSRFKKAVEDVQKRLLETKGIKASHVLVASDEESQEFWDEIQSYGWRYIDHLSEGTYELYGEWYPVLIDKIAQSLGVGFVGTKSSTFSLLSARRVEDWNGDNLRNDTYYVTAFSIGGFSNELIGAMQLIYLGILTQRVPILPPIIPAAHVSEHAGNIAFSDIFNLTTLRSTLRYPILEWKDVKSPQANVMDNPPPSDPALDTFGCWSTQKRTLVETTSSTSSENVLKLDLAYTRLPDFVYLHPEKADELFIKFSGVAAAIQPRYPHPDTKNLGVMVESRLGEGRWAPDEHLACFDLMYYVSSGAAADSGNWFEFEDRFKEAVEELQGRLWRNRNVNASHVLVASDETDPSFWSEVTSYGWKHLNHTAERTHERYGEWYPILLDIVAQSMAVGFVGTQGSTFSLISARRVEDWNSGESVMVSYYD